MVLHTPHDTVRTAALQKPNPSLADVLAIAEAFEATQKSIRTITNEAPIMEVNQLKANNKYTSSRNGSKNKSMHYSNSKLNRDRNNSLYKRQPNKNCNFNRDSGESNQITLQSCSGCGSHHLQKYCKFRDAKCHKCGKTGHIVPVCCMYINRNKFKSRNRENLNNIESIEQIYTINTLFSTPSGKLEDKYFVDLKVNGTSMEFQLDTGATCSIVSLNGYNTN